MKQFCAFVLLILLTLSCTSEESNIFPEEELTEEKLENFLKSMNNGYIFNDNKNARTSLPEPIYFSSIEEMQSFLEEINSSQGPPHELTPYLEGGPGGLVEGYYRDSRYIGGFGVFMNIGFNVNGCSGSNLNSWISGLTLGVSYNHMGGTLNTVNNESINYVVYGVINYNFIVEAIGTVFSQNVSYSGTYNCQ